jgi:excisionase family DNA binding protein
MDDENEYIRAAAARKGSPFLNTQQAAHYMCISERLLEQMRRDGKGPRYRKHGRHIRYRISDLDAYSEDRSSVELPRSNGPGDPGNKKNKAA